MGHEVRVGFHVPQLIGSAQRAMLTARGVYTTQVHTVTLPYPRSPSTYTTVLAFQKATPTPTPTPHSGLSASSIGAIVGSILGTAVLLLLAYFCCFRRGDEEDYYESDSDDQPAQRAHAPIILPPEDVLVRDIGKAYTRPSRRSARDHDEGTVPAPATVEIAIPTTFVHGSADRVQARRTTGEDGQIKKTNIYTRPRRRRHRAPMNEPRSYTGSGRPHPHIIDAAP